MDTAPDDARKEKRKMAIDLAEEFEKYEDEHLKFERVEAPAHPCPDVCAFIVLNNLAPLAPGQDMVVAAEHDEFWLGTNPEALAATATSEDIRLLVRCGVRYDESTDSLAMFA